MSRPVLCLLAAGVAALLVAAGGGAAPAARSRCFGARSRDAVVPCHDPRLRRMVVPSPDSALLEPSEPCTPVLAAPSVCRFGLTPRHARDAFAVAGDSHAVHWRAALVAVARAAGWTGYSATRSTCPLMVPLAERNPRCRGFARGVLRWLGRRTDVHTLFVSGNVPRPRVTSPGYVRRASRIRAFERTLRAVPARITHVFVIHDVPHGGLATQDCVRRAIARHRDAGTLCARPRRAALPTDPAAIAARRLGGRFAVIDLTPYMCSATRCFAVVGGALVLKDTGHLTRTFARTLGPYLWRAVHATLAAAR